MHMTTLKGMENMPLFHSTFSIATCRMVAPAQGTKSSQGRGCTCIMAWAIWDAKHLHAFLLASMQRHQHAADPDDMLHKQVIDGAATTAVHKLAVYGSWLSMALHGVLQSCIQVSVW